MKRLNVKMMLLIVVFFILFCNIISLQAQSFSAVISREYNKADKFSLVNNNNDTIMSFDRNGRMNSIQTHGNNYLLKKRKVLFNSKGDTIAFYKRRRILFPSQNLTVTERKNKKGWIYYIDNHKILEINYTYNKEDKNYYITALSDNLDEIATSILQLSLGRFDKRVVMDYDSDDDFSTAIIIAIVVALS